MKSASLFLASFCCAFLAGAVLGRAADKHPVTHEDIWLMKRVGSPSLSPDGKYAVFPVTEPAYDEKDQTSDLWIVPTDASAAPRQITFTKAPETGVVWSPDSKKIAFSTKRENDESAQIYLLDLIGGGEARRLTNLTAGARLPLWKPDGSAILFVSNVYPGVVDEAANKKAVSEHKARKYKVREYESFPIRYWDHWLDETQPHLFVQSLDGTPAKDLLANCDLVKHPGFAGRESETAEELDSAWSPDGKSVVFAATVERDTSAYAQVSVHLYEVSLTGAEPKRLTPGNESYGKPAFTLDGKYLLATVSPQREKVYENRTLIRFVWPGATNPTPLAKNLDLSVDKYIPGPDGQTVYFIAEDKGYVRAFVAPIDGKEGRALREKKAGVYTGLDVQGSANAPVLVATYDTAINPHEIVRLDPTGGADKPLTQFNVSRAAAIDWLPVREFWFTAKNGKRIHNFITLPPNFDPAQKYPLFLVIHGGAANMYRDSFGLRWNYHLLARPGYVVLLTNYTGSSGFGEKFGQDIQTNPLKGPGEELNEAVDAAIKEFPFVDATKLAAGGASYGGHLANWLEATTTRFKCIVSHSGLVDQQAQWGTSDGIYHRELAAGGLPWGNSPVWQEQSPIHYAANYKTPILLSVGERDFRVPINNTLEHWAALQRMKVPSKLLVWPDENHWIQNGENSRYFYGEVHAWLAKWIK